MAKLVAFEIKINGVKETVTDVTRLDALLSSLIAQQTALTNGSRAYSLNEKAINKLIDAKNRFIAAEVREADVISKSANKIAKDLNFEAESILDLKAKLALLTDEYSRLGKAQNSAIGIQVAKELRETSKELQAQTKILKVHSTGLHDARAAVNAFSTSLFSAFSGDQAAIVKSGVEGISNAIGSLITGNLPATFLQLASAVANILGEAIKFNSDIADSEADVAKNANLSVAQVQALSEKLIRLDTRTSLDGLLKIGDALGKLGIEVTPQVIASLDKLNIALSDEFGNNPEKIATVVGKLKIVFKEFDASKPEDAYLKIGNALNSLAATGAATAPAIAEFSTRIAGTSGVYGLLAADILGVSATLEELGTTAYRGSSGFGRFIKQITSDTKNFEKTLKLTPEVVQQFTGSLISFSDLVNKDVGEAYKTVLGRIKELNLSNTDLAAVYNQLHIVGTGEIEVVSKLSQSYDLLNKRIGDASKAITTTTSIENEFSKKNQNLAGEISKLGNSLQEAFLSGALANGLSSFLSKINQYFNGTKNLFNSLGEEQIKLNELGEAIFDVTSSVTDLNEARRIQLEKLESLKAASPEYFGQIDTEKAQTSLLLDKILRVNENRDEQNTLIARFKLEHPKYLALLKDDTSESAVLVKELLAVNTTNERRNVIIGELRANYPDFFAKLQQELDLTGALKKALDGVNESYGIKRQLVKSQELLLGDLPKQQKQLRDFIDEEEAFKRTYLIRASTSANSLGLTAFQTTAQKEAILLKYINERGRTYIEGTTRFDDDRFKKIVETLGAKKEQLTAITKEIEGLNGKLNDDAIKDLQPALERTELIQKVLFNSIKAFELEETNIEKARKAKDITAETQATDRLATLSSNVKGFLQEVANAGFEIIGTPTGRIKQALDGVKSAADQIRSIQQRIKGDSKTPSSLDGEEISIDKKKPPREKARPSDNPFLTAFETAKKQEEDYYRKQKELTDKLDRDADESRAKSISLSRRREKEIADKVYADKVAEINKIVEKLEIEQQQADEKYGEAIKKGQDYLAKLKVNGQADTEGIGIKVTQLQKDRATYLSESAQKIEDTFKSSGESILELYGELKQKKVEIDEKYDKNLLQDFLKFTDTQTNTAINRINENFNNSLEASADSRVQKLQEILASSATKKQKKALLLSTDREADAREIKLRVDNLEQIYTEELKRLEAFTLSNALHFKSPSLFPEVPKEDIEKQVKTVENAHKQLADAKRREVEKQVTLERAALSDEEKKTQRLNQLKITGLELLSRFAQTQFEIERNNAQAIFDSKTSFLEREYAYKERLFKGDAENIARLEKNKAEEQKKLDLEYAKERQKLAIKEATINTALAIIKVYATSPDPITATIIAAGELIILSEQIRAIKSQKFADGGFTGKGVASRDSTGERPVGVVHEDEYVIPKKVLRTSRGMLIAQEAEKMRRGIYKGNTSPTRFYAEGGFVGNSPYIIPSNVSVTIDDKIMNQLADKMYDAILLGSQSGTYFGAEYANKLKERQGIAATNNTI